jgi:hypothetical protein
MFYQYLGKDPIDVTVPGIQGTITVYPSKNGQRTSNEQFYRYILSDACPQTALFRPVGGYVLEEVAQAPETESAGTGDAGGKGSMESPMPVEASDKVSGKKRGQKEAE